MELASGPMIIGLMSLIYIPAVLIYAGLATLTVNRFSKNGKIKFGRTFLQTMGGTLLALLVSVVLLGMLLPSPDATGYRGSDGWWLNPTVLTFMAFALQVIIAVGISIFSIHSQLRQSREAA